MFGGKISPHAAILWSINICKVNRSLLQTNYYLNWNCPCVNYFKPLMFRYQIHHKQSEMLLIIYISNCQSWITGLFICDTRNCVTVFNVLLKLSLITLITLIEYRARDVEALFWKYLSIYTLKNYFPGNRMCVHIKGLKIRTHFSVWTYLIKTTIEA